MKSSQLASSARFPDSALFRVILEHLPTRSIADLVLLYVIGEPADHPAQKAVHEFLPERLVDLVLSFLGSLVFPLRVQMRLASETKACLFDAGEETWSDAPDLPQLCIAGRLPWTGWMVTYDKGTLMCLDENSGQVMRSRTLESIGYVDQIRTYRYFVWFRQSGRQISRWNVKSDELIETPELQFTDDGGFFVPTSDHVAYLFHSDCTLLKLDLEVKPCEWQWRGGHRFYTNPQQLFFHEESRIVFWCGDIRIYRWDCEKDRWLTYSERPKTRLPDMLEPCDSFVVQGDTVFGRGESLWYWTFGTEPWGWAPLPVPERIRGVPGLFSMT